MNLFPLVKASSQCTQLLGSNPVRFFEFGQAPQLQTKPYATYQLVAGTPYNNLSGPATADHITAQIDVWADDSATSKAVSKAIRQAVENNCYVTSWLGTNKEAETFRTVFTVQFIELRE
jgi:hypothetical protein